MKLERIHHASLCVSDLARAKAFYGESLGLEEIPRPDFPFPGAWYRAGANEVHLIVLLPEVPRPEVPRPEVPREARADSDKARADSDKARADRINDDPAPATPLNALHRHVAFAIDDVGAASAELEKRGYEVVGGGPGATQAWVRDDDGNIIELIRP